MRKHSLKVQHSTRIISASSSSGVLHQRHVQEIDKSYITVFSANVTFLCLQAPPERSGASSAGLAVGRSWDRAQAEQDTSAVVSTPSPCEICSKGSLNYKMSF